MIYMLQYTSKGQLQFVQTSEHEYQQFTSYEEALKELSALKQHMRILIDSGIIDVFDAYMTLTIIEVYE